MGFMEVVFWVATIYLMHRMDRAEGDDILLRMLRNWRGL